MVTYSDLIQIGILVVGIISLFLQASKKKCSPLPSQSFGDHFKVLVEGEPSTGSALVFLVY